MGASIEYGRRKSEEEEGWSLAVRKLPVLAKCPCGGEEIEMV